MGRDARPPREKGVDTRPPREECSYDMVFTSQHTSAYTSCLKPCFRGWAPATQADALQRMRDFLRIHLKPWDFTDNPHGDLTAY